MSYIAYSIAWISTAFVSIAGMYYTNSAWCIWVMLLPAMISVRSNGNGDKSGGE